VYVDACGCVARAPEQQPHCGGELRCISSSSSRTHLVAQDAADASKPSAELAAFLGPAGKHSTAQQNHGMSGIHHHKALHISKSGVQLGLNTASSRQTQHGTLVSSRHSDCTLADIATAPQQLSKGLSISRGHSLVCDKLQLAAKLLVVVGQPLQQRLLVLHLQLSTCVCVCGGGGDSRAE
jgi:hypothetical protein